MAWEQTGNAIKFYAFFVASKVGKSGLTPTVYVARNGSAIVTAGNATEVDATNLPGLYSYELAGASVTVEGEYVAVFRTADATVDAQHIPSLWIVGRAGVENLDATVSSRLPTSSYVAPTTPPTAAAVADAVWDETLAGHAVAGSAGAALSAAGGAADPLLNDVPGSYPSGSAGAALGRIGSNTVTIVSPVSDTGEITLIYGDDYLYADGRALTFTGTTWPVITGGTIALIVQSPPYPLSLAGVVTGAAACYVSLTSAQVSSIGNGVFAYDLQVTLSNSHVVTLQQGTILVQPDVR